MNLAVTTLGRRKRLNPLSRRHVVSQHYEPGTLIVGKYRLEALLGAGGMGTVWRARNESLDAPVALKLIRSGMQGEETEERLMREARVEVMLKHPNIVRVFDFGKTELGDAFIVMEVLDGISLGELLNQRGSLDAVEAVRLVLPVIGALCHAHENGVVHRDLKPHNIFLDRGGLHTGTKLLDFGIAKLIGDDSQRHFSKGRTLLGSPSYMAPEQAVGSKDVDHRADIWAMCVVLYNAISGTQAFPGDGYEVLRKVIDDEVPPLTDTGAGESGLWCVLGHGLEKDPSQRFQSMGELGTALAQWLCDQGESEDLDGNRISRNWGVTPLDGIASAGSPVWLSASSLPRARPRRNVEMFELPAGMADSFARALRPRRMSPRAVAAVRSIVASAVAIAVVLAPSKIGVEPAMSASSSQVQHAPVAEEGSKHLMQVALPDPPVSDTLLTQAAAVPPKRESRKPTYARRSTRPLTETELGLKVAY